MSAQATYRVTVGSGSVPVPEELLERAGLHADETAVIEKTASGVLVHSVDSEFFANGAEFEAVLEARLKPS
jgi:hypothetical protein